MKYHIAAHPHEVAFGAYPAASLKLARERRDEARQQLARGLNPRLLSVLFADVAEEWIQMLSAPAKTDAVELDGAAVGAFKAGYPQ